VIADGARARHALVFDLDDTLAASKSPLGDAMSGVIAGLLLRYDVCIISGAKFDQFERQVLDRLPSDADLAHLHLMPTCGAVYYRWVSGRWTQVYVDLLTDDEAAAAHHALEDCARELGLWEPQSWGLRIENRGAQVTFSALGQEAPLDVKRAWDPDGARKERLRVCAQARLPALEVRSGGTTSVDVTRRGIDKAFGVRRFMVETGRGVDDVTFFGDRLEEGGNDYPVIALGVTCVAVRDPDDTVVKLASFLHVA
jgi:phosphomannomutase